MYNEEQPPEKKTMQFASKIILAISAIAVLAFGIVLADYLLAPKTPLPETFSATRGPVIQEIAVRGKIKTSKKIELSFKYDGILQTINVKEGDSVKKEQELARLDLSALETQKRELENTLIITRAKLDNATRGPQPTLIAAAQRKKEDAAVALERAKLALETQQKQSQQQIAINSEDAQKTLTSSAYYSQNAHTTFQSLFDETGALKKEFSSATPSFRDTLGQDFKDATTLIASASLSLDSLKTTPSDAALNQAYKDTTLLLDFQKNYLEHAAKLLEEATVSVDLSQTTLTAYSTNIATARLNIVGSLSDSALAMRTLQETKEKEAALIPQLEKNIKDANDLLTVAQNELTVIQTPVAESEKAALQAETEKLQAEIDFIKNHIKGSILYAPADAVVYKIYRKKGEFISNKEPFITISHLNSLEAEAYIPEKDILKIRVDDLASVVLSSDNEERTYKGTVVLIDPAEFEVSGKIFYRTVVLFENTNGLAQPGETAQIIIKAAAAENVIMVPQYAIYQKEGASYVEILQNGEIIEKKVDIGLTGSDGFIEIMRGIYEGERVLTRPMPPTTSAQ
jgi:macrolide-specific efflux system membrane fusion protein